MKPSRILTAVLLLAISAPASAPAADVLVLPWGVTPSAESAYARAAAIAELGRKMFFDPTLSASGQIACATCHDPAHGFAAPNASSVQAGGRTLLQVGIRAVPSLMYGQKIPVFTEHYFDSEDDGDDSIDQGPTGGRGWDGRVNRARDQAVEPLLNNDEMANSGPEAVVTAVSRADYANDVRWLYGEDIFAFSARAFSAITEALEFFQETPATFSPFSSKFDAALSGQAQLTEQETRGLVLFNDPARGNCASCHKSAVTSDGRPPLFTDFGFAALGVPRNAVIPANADPHYFDLGLCGPRRRDLIGSPTYCGMFKAPTLRNVALKQSFYHNGVFHSLRDAVAFYAERDTNPSRWYPVGSDGAVHKFDDLPYEYVSNVSNDKPFGIPNVLSEADVDDLTTFLSTLTDGYQVTHGQQTGSQSKPLTVP